MAAGAAAGSINDQNRQVIASNKAVVEANIENTVRAGFRVGLLNMQLGQQRKQMVQAGFDNTVAAQEVLGAATANAAATGTVGASVDAVSSDIQMKLGEAEAARRDAWDLTLTNYNNQLHTTIEGGIDTLQRANGQVAKSNFSESQALTGALVAGVTSFASNYALRSMNLGLGERAMPDTAKQPIGLSSQGMWLGGGGAPVHLGGSFDNGLSLGGLGPAGF